MIVPVLVDNIIVVSHYDEMIAAFQAKRPNWKYGVPTNEAKKMIYSSLLFLDNLLPIKSDILMLPRKSGKINVLTKRVVNHMEEIGADGIFTDYPQKLMTEIH